MVRLTETEKATLEGSRLFTDVDPELVDAILGQSRLRDLKPDEVLLAPDQVNHFIFLVLSGCFEVHVGDQGQQLLATIAPGECIGEMSVLDNQKPTARVIAAEPSRVLSLHQQVVWQFVDATGGMARNLLYIISGRLRINTAALFESLSRQIESERHADLDGLTGLHNRRWLDRTLSRFVTAANAPNCAPLAIILLDIDHFKRFNDSHGHPAGDTALRQVAQAITSGLRPDDMAARYGGEEFTVILPNADAEQALHAAERLCTVVRNTVLEHGTGRPLPSVTISLGVAQYQSGQTAEQLLEAADRVLYQAKHSGRNRAIGQSAKRP